MSNMHANSCELYLDSQHLKVMTIQFNSRGNSQSEISYAYGSDLQYLPSLYYFVMLQIYCVHLT